MKIVYAHNWFLDYRIPVFKELKKITNDNFYVLYNRDNVPQRVSDKLELILGSKAIAFSSEKRLTIGNQKASGDFANKLISITYQPGLYKKIKEIKPDVLVGEGFFRWGLINLVYKFFNKVKYVMLYERTLHTERNAKKPVILIRKLALQFIDIINCNGVQTKDYIISLGFNEKRITNKHMVADTESILFNTKLLAEKEILTLKQELGLIGKVFLYCGQMVERKGVKELLNAWESFKEKSDDESSLLLIGDGPNLDKYRRLNIKDTKFLRKVDFDIIHKYFAVADVFVILTLEDNGSIVVPEAMAAGLPVISSKFNGNFPEYITPANGWVVDPFNLEEVCDVLMEVNNCDNLNERGKNSLDLIKDFTPQIAAKNIYESCRLAYEGI